MSTRSRALTVIGWLFIVVGVGGLLRDLWTLLAPGGGLLAGLRESFGELGPAWALHLLAVVGGAGLLAGRNWARWLLVCWMAVHVVLSLLHSPVELLVHGVLFAPIGYFLFRPPSPVAPGAGNAPSA